MPPQVGLDETISHQMRVTIRNAEGRKHRTNEIDQPLGRNKRGISHRQCPAGSKILIPPLLDTV